MGLKIEGASIGFDRGRANHAVAIVKDYCVSTVPEELNRLFKEFQDRVNDVWVGQSAEIFKDNFFIDKEEIVKGLAKVPEAFEGEMGAIEEAFNKMDESVLERR